MKSPSVYVVNDDKIMNTRFSLRSLTHDFRLHRFQRCHTIFDFSFLLTLTFSLSFSLPFAGQLRTICLFAQFTIAPDHDQLQRTTPSFPLCRKMQQSFLPNT